jgi:phage terminase large subunit
MSVDVFKKTLTQKEAVNFIVNSKATNLCLYGGSRSGKSFLFMFAIIVRACKCKSAHLIVRNTFNSAKLSIWNKTLPDVLNKAFPSLKVKYNRTDYICTLPNGSTILIGGLDDGDKLERLLGTEFSTLWINESNQVPFSAVSKLRTRLAEKNMLRKLTFYDLNPTNINSWVYQLFELKVDPQDGETLKDQEDYASFKMNVQGNLENVDSEYLKMLEKLPEAERKRFLLGEYSDSSNGSAVYAFNESEHVSDNAIRLDGTVFVGSDFNIEYNSDILSSMTGTQLYVWDEVQIQGDTYKKAFELRRKINGGADIISDSTGANRSTKGKSDHIILRESGFNIIPTQNPYVEDKIANLNRCFMLGLIVINPACKKLIRDLKMLRWDKHGQLDQKTDKSLSHLVDCLGYLCWKLFPMIKKSQNSTRQF